MGVVAVVFKGRPADQPATWAMVSAKPSLSMMGDPKLIMEWGIAPFGSAPVEAVVPSVSHSPLGDRNVYRLNESWQTFEWEANEPNAEKPVQGFVANEITQDSDVITVKIPVYVADNDALYSPPKPDTSEPGVIMINGERIEYFQMTYFDRTFTFSELRRGTRGTRPAREQRLVAIGTGQTTRLAGVNVTPEVRVLNPDGSHTDMQLGQQFTTKLDEDGIVVTLLKPLAAGSSVIVSHSNPAVHRVGDLVRDVSQTVYRRGCPFRVRNDLTDVQITSAGYAA